MSDKEAAILNSWIESLPGSAFALAKTDVAQGTVVIRDLLLPDRVLTVHDAAAAKHGEPGQILLSRPLPERDRVRLAGSTAVLPASEEDSLRAFIEEKRQAYLVEHEGSTMAQFLRDRAYLLTHYALEWAVREGRPAVAADDPDAHKPGGSAMRRLVKWQQERVQSRG